jgi:hypothetical protein
MESEQRLAFIFFVAAFLPVTRAGDCAARRAVVCVSPRLRVCLYVCTSIHTCAYICTFPRQFPDFPLLAKCPAILALLGKYFAACMH